MHDGIWTHRVDDVELRDARLRLDERVAAGDTLTLGGMTFAVKDNIDVGGIPTTLGAPELGYLAERSAPAVDRLVDAGALFVGKTNLDQFATGLVGTRSPTFGICRNPIDPDYIAGGSSSGSAVAVATGAVSFSLGTDTAGSGRVPAACCGIVGMKPSVGLVATTGVFPASPSFDCLSVFTTSCGDAADVLAVLAPDVGHLGVQRHVRTVGVPDAIDWSGDADAARCFDAAQAALADVGITIVEIDARPLHAAGAMLYDSALLAERLAAFGHLLVRSPDAVDPTVLSLVLGAETYSARDSFAALARLRELQAEASSVWDHVDTLVVPTITRHPTITEVLADPIGPNRRLGTYTSFVNPLGWSALAVPAGHRGNGLPFGISMIGPTGADAAVLELGARFSGEPAPRWRPSGYELAVVGAHLTGEPLHHELVDRGAELVMSTLTAPSYRLFALETTPPKPGLVRDPSQGAAIEVEVWRLAPTEFGSFVAGVPRPLAIGKVELADGNEVSGFVCEPEAIAAADEITSFGGWREWRRSNGRVGIRGGARAR